MKWSYELSSEFYDIGYKGADRQSLTVGYSIKDIFLGISKMLYAGTGENNNGIASAVYFKQVCPLV